MEDHIGQVWSEKGNTRVKTEFERGPLRKNERLQPGGRRGLRCAVLR